MHKKSIAALTVLALTSLFSLTQATSASAAEQGTLNVQSMDIQTLRQAIKDAKNKFEQQVEKRINNKLEAEEVRKDLEKEIPFMINSFRKYHYEWYQKNEFPTHNLEDSLTDTNDLTDLLNQYKVFLKD